jgi:glycosyltransferase involved in cell wall biosynthesis
MSELFTSLSEAHPSSFPAVPSESTGTTSMETLSVAIVMRTKNRPLLLYRALSSVLLQRYSAWRLYLVNDGGDKNQVEALVTEYAHAFEGRITVIHHEENRGMQAASNAALTLATEDLVVLHDDDDAWHPDFLEETVAFLNGPEHAAFVAVATGHVLVHERIEGNEVVEIGRIVWGSGWTPGWTHRRTVIDSQSLIAANQIPRICMVFRRTAIAAMGPYNRELALLGDWEFNLRLSLLGDIGFIDRKLAYYHQRVQGVNSSYVNTTLADAQLHEQQNIRLRNAMLRAALAKEPENLGLLLPVIRSMQLIEQRLATIETTLHHQQVIRGAGVEAPKGASPFDYLLASVEIELGKLCCTLGRNSLGTSLWNRAQARRAEALGGDFPTQLSPLQCVVAGLELEFGKLLCTLGLSSIGTLLWNKGQARARGGR